ncbi:MAG: pitrilysin family protein [Patescibacteria group bacterium]
MTFTKTKLKSGMRLITVPMKDTKTVTVLVAAQAGSKYESKDINGISHFLEHMFFKGTARRPSTLAIAEELDSIGGEYNAFTGKEWTGYYAKADSRHFDLILDVISDIFLHSKLDSAEIEREKLVILEEMNMYQDTPIKYIDDLLEELLYGNQPQGWKVIGEAETIKAITQQRLRQYLKERYTAENTVVIVAGDIDKVQSSKFKVQSYLADISQKKVEKKSQLVKEVQTKPQVKVHYKKTDQTHLAMALRAYPADHKSLPALKLLSIILGGNMSSRLFINIRERQGLCYYINSTVEAYKDCGYLLVKAGVDNKRTLKAVKLILKELRQIQDQGITQSEFKRAKDFIRGKLALSLETSDELAFWAGGQEMILGIVKTPEQKLLEIERVNINQIKKIAQEVITAQGLNLAVIGAYRQKDKFKRILEL